MTLHNHTTRNVNLTFNGERAVEGSTPMRIWLDHVSRYKFASDYVKEKTVLDIACGTGYGADILRAAGAKKVFGLDISNTAIEFANNRYRSKELEFKVGNILNIDFPETYFDVITCFETIEHVKGQEEAFKELKKVLKPEGLLIISSPNRRLTSPGKSISEQPDNIFHSIEYSTKEFISVLENFFQVIGVYGQRGISKLFLLPVFKGMTRRFYPAVLDPEKGRPELTKASSLMEYRYITAVCRK